MLVSYPHRALPLVRELVPDPYPHWRHEQPLKQASWRTLIGDQTSSARPAPASCERSLGTLFDLVGNMGEQVGIDMLFEGASTGEVLRAVGLTPEQKREIQWASEEWREIECLFDTNRWSRTFAFCVIEISMRRRTERRPT